MDIERHIENALSTYADVAPAADLAERVLHGIGRARARRRSVRHGIVAAGLAAAAVLVAMGLNSRHVIHRPGATVPGVRAQRDIASATVGNQPAPARQVHRRRRALRQARPGVPTGLTIEELALLALVERQPAAAAQAFAAIEQGKGELPEISPIEIKPLPGEGGQ